MRIRLTDGTRHLDLRLPDDTPLADAEATTTRLYAALTSDQPATRPAFGYARDLDGISLDSDTERIDQADPIERHDDEDDET